MVPPTHLLGGGGVIRKEKKERNNALSSLIGFNLYLESVNEIGRHEVYPTPSNLGLPLFLLGEQIPISRAPDCLGIPLIGFLLAMV